MNKKLLTVAIAGALTAPLAAQAVNFKISGHINRQVRFIDDGAASDTQFLDNGASRSRMRVKGSGDLGNGLKAGLYSEFALVRQRGSSSVIKTGGTGGAIDIRHSAIWFSGNFGKLTLGHTSTSADCADCADFSGAWMADEVSTLGDNFFSVKPRANGSAEQTVTSVGSTAGGLYSTIDGGRNAEVRYDSPNFGPATIAVDIGNNERWGAAIRASGALAGGKYSAIAAWDSRRNSSGFTQLITSAGYLFSQGTNISVVYAERNFYRAGGAAVTPPGAGVLNPTGRQNAQQIWVGIGHNWGNNSVRVSWGESNDQITDGSDLTQIGFGFNRSFPKAGVDIYAGYHNISFDTNAKGRTALGLTGGAAGTDLQDMNLFTLGSRIKFN